MSVLSRQVACLKVYLEDEAVSSSSERSEKVAALFVPELVVITLAIDQIKTRMGAVDGKCLLPQHRALERRLDELKQYATQFQPGVIPLGQHHGERLVKGLYAEMAGAGIPWPKSIPLREIPFWHALGAPQEAYQFEVCAQNKNLSFLEKVFPYVGIVITTVLVLGVTASSAVTILSWGWPGMMLYLCVSAKLAANFVDIQGGPERRMARIAQALYRMATGIYFRQGQLTLPKCFLNLLVSSTMAGSAYVSWFFAWNSLKALPWIVAMGETMMWYLVATYACSMFFSSFSRLYDPLYTFLWSYFNSWMNMSDVDEALRLQPETVSSVQQARIASKDDKAKCRIERIRVLLEAEEARRREEVQRNSLLERVLQITPLRDLEATQLEEVKAEIQQAIDSTILQPQQHTPEL
ncbi:MAG: hypothetical protein U1E78_10315 [Gammaproteobacteria bacterium]